jgi:CheY-like chemotaxis protein
MHQGTVRVLVIGETDNGSSYLRGQLESRGCLCWFARSTEESIALFGQHSFHLILSTTPMQQENPLLVELGDSNCTVFSSCPVEDGCWWVPLVRRGQRCSNAPALRSSEFIIELNQMLQGIRLEDTTRKVLQ